MKRPLIVGVMGGASAHDQDMAAAHCLGVLIAQQGWVLLNGGRNCGIMAASARGAASAGGLTLGILPDAHAGQACEDIQIPICTGMGSARNVINVLSSQVVVACPGGAGTISEVALALKHGKPVISLNFDLTGAFPQAVAEGRLIPARSPEDVIDRIHHLIGHTRP